MLDYAIILYEIMNLMDAFKKNINWVFIQIQSYCIYLQDILLTSNY